MECVVSCSSTRTTRGGHREPQTHLTRPKLPAPPRNRETHQQNGGPLRPYNSSKRRAGVEPVRSESREGDHKTVIVGMKGMQGIEAMLRSVLEAQEKLAHQVGELAQKVEGMDQKVVGVEQQ